MSTPAEKANLARIRDNQRRSRARRKEYLQELEHRLRLCELQGVEASSEIQMAARKVADENRRLRGLLNKQGVSDDFIESYLQSATSTAGDSHYRSSATGQAVQTLEHLLAPRRPSCIDQTMSFPPMPTRSGREQAMVSVSPTQSGWESVQSTPNSMERGPHQLPRRSPPQHFVTTPTSTTASMPRSETAYAPHGGLNSILEDPRHANRSPPSGHGDGHSSHGVNYDVSMAQSYGHMAPAHHYASNSGSYCPPRRGSHPNSLPPSSGYLPSSTVSPATSDTSCQVGTELMSTMTGADPSALRANLGCGPNLSCQVDGQTFSRSLDRYNPVVPTTGPPIHM